MTEKNTVKKEQVEVIFQMIDCKILISRSGLARQVLTIKPDVKFVIKMLKLSNMGPKEIALVSGNVGGKKNLDLCSHRFIVFNHIPRDIIFSSVVSFAFLVLVFFVCLVDVFRN